MPLAILPLLIQPNIPTQTHRELITSGTWWQFRKAMAMAHIAAGKSAEKNKATVK